MLPQVRLLDEMDEQMCDLLQRNLEGITESRARYREHLAAMQEQDLLIEISYFGRHAVTGLGLLETHALHLAGHRFQVRYVRGTYSRARGTRKSDFDPW